MSNNEVTLGVHQWLIVKEELRQLTDEIETFLKDLETKIVDVSTKNNICSFKQFKKARQVSFQMPPLQEK
jgi:hypothetical protein